MTDYHDCFICNRCEGAALLWPPILYNGSLESPILVVAQNPGSVGSGSRSPIVEYTGIQLQQMRSGDLEFDELYVKTKYEWDFSSNYCNTQLSKVFSKSWLAQCCYTNAVLCRTRENERPSEEMIENCRHWTLKLLNGYERKIVIAVGVIARDQVMPLGDFTHMNWGVPYSLSNGAWILPIKHYAAWQHEPSHIVLEYRKTFEALVRRLEIPYLFD